MQSADDGSEGLPTGRTRRRPFSRRGVLRASAIGIAAALTGGTVGYVTGWSDRAGADLPDWTAADIPPQHGRRVIITGANGYPQNDRSGLGYHQALALARAGADVTIASRNRTRGEEAVQRILAEAPGSMIRFETLDLADLSSVGSFADRIFASGQGLDVLINNAGVMGRFERELSADGYERVFATNTIGHFALTAHLMPKLRRGRDPRIVWVGSSRVSAGLPFADLHQESSYDYAAAYDHSKLANLLLAFEFDRRGRALGWGVSSLAAHPGVARTNLIPDGPGLDSREGWRFRRLPFLFQPAEQGAVPVLFAATSPHALAGGYYGPNGFLGLRGLPAMAPVPTAARDRQAAATLWTALEDLTRLSPGQSNTGSRCVAQLPAMSDARPSESVLSAEMPCVK